MRPRNGVLAGVAIVVALVMGLVYWQNFRLSRVLSTVPADAARELMVSSLASQVLTSGVDDSARDFPQPLLDQYQMDPALTRRRYLLVVTWLHARNMFKNHVEDQLPEGAIVSSSSFADVHSEDALDGWGSPFCVASYLGRTVFLSSGGNGVLDCGEDTRQNAKRAASNFTDSRITKVGKTLAVVYAGRGGR